MNSYQGPGRYRHYKGEEYEVLGLAVKEDTVIKGGVAPGIRGTEMELDQYLDQAEAATRLVVYRPVSERGSMIGPKGDPGYEDVAFWARELDDFNAVVQREHGEVPRFAMEETEHEFERARRIPPTGVR